MDKIERLSNVTEIIKNIVLSLAILAGGLWSVYIFNAELHVENAKAELKTLEKQLKKVAKLEIEVIANQIDTPREEDKIIIINLIFYNHGTETNLVNVVNDPIRISKIHFDTNGKPILGETLTTYFLSTNPLRPQDKATTKSLVIDPGDKDRRVAFAKLDQEGLYRIEFVAIDEKMPVPHHDLTVWAAESYIYVK